MKNIEEPVRAYKVVMAAEEEPKAKEAVKPELELPDKPSVAEAYEFVLRGKMHYNRFNAEDVAAARRFFKKAVELDPRYTRAHAHLVQTDLTDALWRQIENTSSTVFARQDYPSNHTAVSHGFLLR